MQTWSLKTSWWWITYTSPWKWKSLTLAWHVTIQKKILVAYFRPYPTGEQMYRTEDVMYHWCRAQCPSIYPLIWFVSNALELQRCCWGVPSMRPSTSGLWAALLQRWLWALCCSLPVLNMSWWELLLTFNTLRGATEFWAIHRLCLITKDNSSSNHKTDSFLKV